MKCLKIFCFLACFTAISLSQNTTDQIKSSSNTLASKEKQEKEINRYLDEIATSLKKEEATLLKTEQDIDSLNQKIKVQQKNVDSTKGELDDLILKNQELQKAKKELEEGITKIIAKEFSYFVLIDKGYIESKDGVITNEILKKASKNLENELEKYKDEFLFIDKKIDEYSKKINDIQASIKDLELKKKALSNLKKNKTKTIKDIEIEKNEYTKKLQLIKSEKDELKQTLENLKIIEKQAKVEDKKLLTTEETIRQLGSSYQTSKVKKYSGAKTIAPLSKYTVIQKFGDYIDPVYNIKIFNESVVLRSIAENDEVKSVLDGKVIFAKETQILKNVVVIENSNGIHTIYAHLSKIAPTIKVGNKVKKGYVIGRVERDLTFEVTQQNYHINPLELISK